MELRILCYYAALSRLAIEFDISPKGHFIVDSRLDTVGFLLVIAEKDNLKQSEHSWVT